MTKQRRSTTALPNAKAIREAVDRYLVAHPAISQEGVRISIIAEYPEALLGRSTFRKLIDLKNVDWLHRGTIECVAKFLDVPPDEFIIASSNTAEGEELDETVVALRSPGAGENTSGTAKIPLRGRNQKELAEFLAKLYQAAQYQQSILERAIEFLRADPKFSELMREAMNESSRGAFLAGLESGDSERSTGHRDYLTQEIYSLFFGSREEIPSRVSLPTIALICDRLDLEPETILVQNNHREEDLSILKIAKRMYRRIKNYLHYGK